MNFNYLRDLASQQLMGQNGSQQGNMIPKGYRQGRIQQFTPEQMEMLEQLMGYLSPEGRLGSLASGDESYFDEMEAPALRQAAALQGNLASRFSGMGLGGRRSSGFQNTSSQAMNEFAENLQSKRQDYMRQALNDLMGYSNMLLGQRPYENFLVQKENRPSTTDRFLQLAGSLLGSPA